MSNPRGSSPSAQMPRRLIPRTRAPLSRYDFTRREPKKPVLPVTTTVLGAPGDTGQVGRSSEKFACTSPRQVVTQSAFELHNGDIRVTVAEAPIVNCSAEQMSAAYSA